MQYIGDYKVIAEHENWNAKGINKHIFKLNQKHESRTKWDARQIFQKM